MALSKNQRRNEARRKSETAQKQRKMARLGVTSLPEKPKHASKKKKK